MLNRKAYPHKGLILGVLNKSFIRSGPQCSTGETISVKLGHTTPVILSTQQDTLQVGGHVGHG